MRGLAVSLRAPLWEKLVVLGATVLCVAGIVAEWASLWARDVWVDHPLLTGVVSGGLVLAPLLLVLERSLERRQVARELAFEAAATAQAEAHERRETERWRGPAWDAIETYLYVARLTSEAFNDRFRVAATAHGIDRYQDRVDVLVPLAREHPEEFQAIHDAERDAITRTGMLAVGATNTLVLYPPFRSLLTMISDVQRTQRAVIEQCQDIAFLKLRRNHEEEGEKKARELAGFAFGREALINRIETALLELPGPGTPDQRASARRRGEAT